MSDLVITAANVLQGTSASVISGIAGVAITAGQTVYQASIGGLYLLAKSNNINTATVMGIALNNAAASQPIDILTSGDIIIGATTAIGEVYVLSAANAGGIAPVADLATGNYTDVLGIATSATNIQISIQNSGTPHH